MQSARSTAFLRTPSTSRRQNALAEIPAIAGRGGPDAGRRRARLFATGTWATKYPRRQRRCLFLPPLALARCARPCSGVGGAETQVGAEAACARRPVRGLSATPIAGHVLGQLLSLAATRRASARCASVRAEALRVHHLALAAWRHAAGCVAAAVDRRACAPTLPASGGEAAGPAVTRAADHDDEPSAGAAAGAGGPGRGGRALIFMVARSIVTVEHAGRAPSAWSMLFSISDQVLGRRLLPARSRSPPP